MTETAVPPAYEPLLQRFISAVDREREDVWEASDTVAKVLSLITTREERRIVLGAFAEAGHCSIAKLRQRAECANAFGTEYRYPHISWTLFRSAVNAAKRTGRTAQEILDEAVDKNLHVPEVNAMGQSKKRTLSLAKVCDGCGSKVRVSVGGEAAKAFRHAAIPCPVCVWALWTDGKDAKEAEKLGALE